MIDDSNYEIPRSSISFRFSKAAIGFLLATAALCVLLVFSTLQNINRAQMLMERFLVDKGEIILNSITASNSASTRHLYGRDAWFHNLLVEHGKEESIQFISINNFDGTTLYQVGYPDSIHFSAEEQDTIIADSFVTRFDSKAGLFIISKRFDRGVLSLSEGQQTAEEIPVISIGILTEQFDQARQQDVHHTLFMGAILLLVGLAGLYFLFLYQKMRRTSSILADMKLYTDSILESIPVSIIALDGEGRISSCNRNSAELTGRSVTDMQGENVYDLFPENFRAISLETDTIFDYPIDLEDGSGGVTPLRISCSPLISHMNEKIGHVLIIRDMSSIRDMEVQLERSRRMAALGKMAAGIAHEIRNPLGTLRGFSQFFGSQKGSGEKNQEYSELMIGEIDRLNHIVSGLLQFSNPPEPHRRSVVVDDLISKVATLFEADLATVDIEFSWQKNSGIELFVDPDLLLQVLMNLLRNSIAVTPKGGSISLTCSEDDQNVFLAVIDSGCGMSEQVREKMFDPFFTTSKVGTGLGLAVSHQIMEQHRATIEVTTELGVGSTVTLVFPKR